MDKKPEHILKNGLDFLSGNDASSNPRITILIFLLDFLSGMTLAQFPEIEFFVQNSRIRVKVKGVKN